MRTKSQLKHQAAKKRTRNKLHTRGNLTPALGPNNPRVKALRNTGMSYHRGNGRHYSG